MVLVLVRGGFVALAGWIWEELPGFKDLTGRSKGKNDEVSQYYRRWLAVSPFCAEGLAAFKLGRRLQDGSRLANASPGAIGDRPVSG